MYWSGCVWCFFYVFSNGSVLEFILWDIIKNIVSVMGWVEIDWCNIVYYYQVGQ